MKLLNKTFIKFAVSSSFLIASSAGAEPTDDFETLKQEIKLLHAEVNYLKKEVAANKLVKSNGSIGPDENIEAYENKQKEAVVMGNKDNGIRLPGSQTSLRYYGYIEAHALHDLEQTAPSDVFTNLMFQPLDNAGGQDGRTKFTAQTSRIGFATTTPTANGDFKTILEMDFYSYDRANRNQLHLRHAYGEYAGFLVGKTWSTFMDVDNLPETLDFTGVIGAPFSRRTMVRYANDFPKVGIKITFAAEDPEDQFEGGSSNEKMPQLIARLDKNFNKGAVNLRTLFHEKRSFAESKYGYGIALGGNYKITDKDLIMGQYTYVEGDIDQLYGSNGYSIDAATGNLAFDKNQGLALGYTRDFNSKLRGTLAYGMNIGDTSQLTDNHKLYEVFFNLIYSPINHVELGLEYMYGKRKTFTDEQGTLSRFDLMGRYIF